MKVLTIILITVVLLVGCKSKKELLSLTPFWWVNNLGRVDNVGGLRQHPDVIGVRNYLDNKKMYFYRIDSGKVCYRTALDPDTMWHDLPGGNPHGCNGKLLKVLLLAADNNRLFVLAEDPATRQRSLWWYCMQIDCAGWAKILITAVGDFMKPGYSTWFKCAHEVKNRWINLQAFREFLPTLEPHVRRIKENDGKISYKVDAYNVPRQSIDVNDIVDIAVGHWTGTVVTYYVLMKSTGKIMYIDEEIAMDRWKEVPNSEYPLQGDPGVFDSTARICASNSVISVYYHAGDSAYVSWIRWDFHNPLDFSYWPLNWCDTMWHRISCPVKNADYLLVNSNVPADDTVCAVWKTPEGISRFDSTINFYAPEGVHLSRDDLKGFLATYDTALVTAYPLEICVFKGDSVLGCNVTNKTPGNGRVWSNRTGGIRK
jgi:hypothetical protein